MDGTALKAGHDHLIRPAAESPYPNLTPRVQPTRVRQIWAVGGGKGGVGKSLVASSLAISLARRGKRVIAIDLDLGGANLHTALGVDLPQETLSDFFNQRVRTLEECIVPTGLANLEIISGAQDSMGAANVGLEQKAEFLRSVRNLDAEYLVFDLGAGTNYHTLDFFIFSDVGLITLLPEPTSIENGYRFIKSAYFRHLLRCPDLAPVRQLIELATDQKNSLGIKSPADLFREVHRTAPELAYPLKREIETFTPRLIMNQTRTQTDVDIGSSIKTVCKKYFGIQMDYLGALDYDSAVWQAVRRKRPVMTEFPNSRLAASLEQMTQNLLSRPGGIQPDLR